MAKKFIGGLPVRGVLALCAILLLAPEARSQNISVKKKTYTISGAVGEPGVTMQGLPGAPMTDQNGVYSVDVEVGWGGTVRPIKPGYTFEPRERTYPGVRAHLTQENYQATLQTYTISGSVGLPGVRLSGFPTEVISDPSGRYTTTVPYGWTGTVMPDKTGYRFEPTNRAYSQVNKDATSDSYKAAEMTFTISGSVGVEGVVMQGLPGNPVTGQGGSYSVDVKYGWSGQIRPSKEGHHFTPEMREYANVTDNQTNQGYAVTVDTYQISGTTGMAGVVMKGLPGDPVTDMNGYYSVTVTHGWSAKVTPDKPGYSFRPPSKDYPKVVASYEGQDYDASIVYLKINGNAGTGGVTMSGLPGDPVSDAGGFYSAEVQYGWVGSVVPQKEGWAFNPPNRQYSSIAVDQVKQDYQASPIIYRISGNAGGMAGVVMQGLPGSPVSGADGSYAAEVPYNWTGTITPRMGGYTFEPASREYQGVLSEQPFQDYVAQVRQYSISGQIRDESGNPVPEVAVVSDSGVNWAKTDAEGRFDLKVNHGSKGRITPTKEGFSFSPTMRTFDPVNQDIPNMSFAAKVKMLTITNQIKAGTEPIQGVTATVDPGGNTAVTGADGKYTVSVPYGWTGRLIFTHPEFDFDPDYVEYTNVTENIDSTAPRMPVTPPVTPAQPPVTPTQPPVTPTQPPVTPTQPPVIPPTPGLTQRQQIEQRIAQIQQELNAMLNQPGPLDLVKQETLLADYNRLQQLLNAASPGGQPSELVTRQPGEAIQPPFQDEMMGFDLLDVLMDLSREAGVKIAVDATVQHEPVAVGYASLANLPPAMALQKILASASTEYAFEMVDDRTYKVYRPVSNVYAGSDLRAALQDLSMAVNVAILPDPNVTGEVWASFTDVPLETALQMMLAGTPFVYKRTPHYYLVADRGQGGVAFMDISETRRIRLSNTTATRALNLLHPRFREYVQAEPIDPLDPNDPGTILIVTAPATIADRIMEDIGRIDYRRRHVLLDARVVVMERGDLLNLGVEWGFPSIRYGGFRDSSFENDPDIASSWLRGLQIGYSPDRTFTDSLLMALNLLSENSQADIISSPQVLAQDGKQSEIRVVTEEWFWMGSPTNQTFGFSYGELEKIESGTVLTITPHIGDNNDITLEMAVEVSDSVAAGRGSELPVITRRVAKNYATVEDGGTVALAGLTENRAKLKDKKVPGLSNLPLIGALFRNRENDKATREVAVFVTAHLIPEGRQTPYQAATQPQEVRVNVPPAGEEFTEGLRDSLARRSR